MESQLKSAGSVTKNNMEKGSGYKRLIQEVTAYQL